MKAGLLIRSGVDSFRDQEERRRGEEVKREERKEGRRRSDRRRGDWPPDWATGGRRKEGGEEEKKGREGFGYFSSPLLSFLFSFLYATVLCRPRR